MKDAALLGSLLLAFATLVTTHVAIAVRLVRAREDRLRAALAWFIPPLAPLYALRRGWRVSALLWLGSVVVYALALIISLR